MVNLPMQSLGLSLLTIQLQQTQWVCWIFFKNTFWNTGSSALAMLPVAFKNATDVQNQAWQVSKLLRENKLSSQKVKEQLRVLNETKKKKGAHVGWEGERWRSKSGAWVDTCNSLHGGSALKCTLGCVGLRPRLWNSGFLTWAVHMVEMGLDGD